MVFPLPSSPPLLSDPELATLLGDTPAPIPSNANWPMLDALHHRTALLLGKRLKVRFSPKLSARAYSTQSSHDLKNLGLTVLLQLHSPKKKPLPLAFTLDKHAAHLVADLLLGGIGPANLKPHFSNIEKRMLVRLSDALIAAIQLALQPILPTRAIITHWLPHQNPLPQLTQQPLLSAMIKIGTTEACTPIHIHWPTSNIYSLWPQAIPTTTPLTSIPTSDQSSAELFSEKTSPKHLSQHLSQHLSHNRVRVATELGNTSMPLGKFLQLKLGDTITLDQSVDQPLKVLIEGIPFFQASRSQQQGQEAFILKGSI